MSKGVSFLQGRFGRVGLIDLNAPLVTHAHHHCHVLIKVVGADGAFRVRGVRCPLTDDRAVLVNAWEPHAYEPATTESTFILALYIEPAWLAEIHSRLTVSGHPRFFPRNGVPVTPRLRIVADDLASAMVSMTDASSQRVESLIFDLMIAVIEPFSLWKAGDVLREGGSPARHDPRIREAIAVMRARVGMELDVDGLAGHCGLSRTHFFELFRRATNLTPGVFANELRMEAAFAGLAHSRAPIADLGYRLGFSAPGHFTRFFRHHIGVTPSQYRKVVDLYESGQATLA
jgi:AraC family transcriptional regulator